MMEYTIALLLDVLFLSLYVDTVSAAYYYRSYRYSYYYYYYYRYRYYYSYSSSGGIIGGAVAGVIVTIVVIVVVIIICKKQHSGRVVALNNGPTTQVATIHTVNMSQMQSQPYSYPQNYGIQPAMGTAPPAYSATPGQPVYNMNPVYPPQKEQQQRNPGQSYPPPQESLPHHIT